jgi:hypothetical protein
MDRRAASAELRAMGHVIIPWFDAFDYLPSRRHGPGEGTMEGRREYALSGTYAAFVGWMRADPIARARVTYLTPQRAAALVAAGAVKGMLHRLEGWETSPARTAAERLEG